MNVTLNLAFAGLGIGAVAALAGLGLLVTYRATGVFNLAFGAIAVAAAYLVWQCTQQWHWPVGVAAIVVLGGFCPLLGFALDRVVFRPLRARAAGAAESLVASIGVFVLVIGTVTTVWGRQTRLDAPSLAPSRSLHLTDQVSVRLDVLVDLAIVLTVLIGLLVLTRTRLGTFARAVVENRALAELTRVRADRVSSIAWALGSSMAGLAGVLIAPLVRLDPFGLTLAVLETMAVIVVARLVDPVAVVASALALGVVQSEITRVDVAGRAGAIVDALGANLFVVALLLTLLVLRRLREPGGSDSGAATGLATRGDVPVWRFWWLPSCFVLGVPLLLGQEDLRIAQHVPALAIVFVSIVVVTGYTGQLSLGQAGFAGLGALLTAQLTGGHVPFFGHVPPLAALVLAVLAVGTLGFLVGWPAIRRRGLFLALTTFSIAAVASRFVFEQPVFTSDLQVGALSPFGSERSFYLFELACLGVALLVVQNHHYGRLGRALQAVRDDEAGAQTCGVDVRRIRVWAFAVSAGLAALGGALLATSDRAFDSTSFDPVVGLVWFAAVVVFGVDSAAGAVLGAALIVTLDSIKPDVSTLVIGLAAVAVGWLPGGLVYSARRAAAASWRRLATPARPASVDPRSLPIQLSPVGRALAARRAR